MNVVLMADVTGGSLAVMPAGALAGVPKLAGYVTGSAGIAWSAGEWAAHPSAVRIDQSPGLAEFAAGRADVADVEPGAATPGSFIAALKVRVAGGHGPGTAYGSDGPLASIGAALIPAGVTSAPGCWLADWNLSFAQASALIGASRHGMVIRAVQWASPTSNPRTMLPGSAVTLAQANVDLSAADATWPGQAPAPAKVVSAVTATLHYVDGSSETRKVWP